MHRPDDCEIERRIEHGEKPALALYVRGPAGVGACGTGGCFAECRGVGCRIDQPVFATQQICRAHNRATRAARFVDPDEGFPLQSTGSTKTSMRPPQARPTDHAVSSLTPNSSVRTL